MVTSQIEYTAVDTVADTYHACYPDTPLEGGDSRYVDLTNARTPPPEQNLSSTIARRILRTPPPDFHKQLVTGHRGGGKSTELWYLTAQLQESKIFTVYIDIETKVSDLNNEIQSLNLLLVIAKEVHEKLKQERMGIRGKFVRRIESWFSDTILTREQSFDTRINSKLLPSIPGFLGFSRRSKKVVSQTLSRELDEFEKRLNQFLDKAQDRLIKAGYIGLAVIVDGLEKIQYKEASEGRFKISGLFVQQDTLLKLPNCHIVYTTPTWLVSETNLGQSFSDVDFIPMVMITERKDNKPYKPGLQAMLKVIKKRVDISKVFDDKNTVYSLVEASGGSLRDLLRMVRFSCDFADKIIDKHAAEGAIKKLAGEYGGLIRDEHRESIVKVAHDRQIDGSDVTGWLLRQRLILRYFDTEPWYDLHPLIKDNTRVQDWLASGAFSEPASN